MNQELVNKRLFPKRAIIVYSDNKRSYQPRFYLESREIESRNGKAVLGAPRPLTDNILKDIARAYMKDHSANMDFGRIVPEHILHGSNKPGQTIVIWYRPAMLRNLNLGNICKGVKKICKGVKKGAAYVPATLYVILNRELYIYALMTDERPKPDTKLYNAPFGNIYESGNVCLGTARVGKAKQRTFEKEAERFEVGFYQAEQTHTSQKEVTKTPLSKLWPELMASQKPFPSKNELIQHKTYKTFGDLLNKTLTDKDLDYDEN